MPTRGVVRGYALNSDCGVFQYWLARKWGSGPALVFVMLNPSTGDADVDDRTIIRCMGFGRREGYDGILLLNLYAYITANPMALWTCSDPVGPDNDTHLRKTLTEQAQRGTPVVAGWGATATPNPNRAAQVLGLMPGVTWRCLGRTQAGHPRHPLYIPGDQPLEPFGAFVDGPDHAARPLTRRMAQGPAAAPRHAQRTGNDTMTPQDRALSQASIDFCMGQDPRKSWRRDDFIDYVAQTTGVDNLITVGTMTAPLRYYGVIEQVSPGWWRTKKDAPTLTPEVLDAYWRLPASERSHQNAAPTSKPQPTCGVCGLQHLGEC